MSRRYIDEEECRYRLRKARVLAKEYGWQEIDHQSNIYMVSFSRDGVRLNYYYSRRTVGTAMLHPTKGSTQLFRQDVGTGMLRKIFDYPRIHTRVGYYRKD